MSSAANTRDDCDIPSYARALFHQSAFGVARIDSQTGRFIRVNQRYCDILGYPIEVLCGLTFGQITHPEDLSRDLAAMDRIRRGEIDNFQIEKRYIRQDGATVWVKLSVMPLWHPGEFPDFHLALVEDITASKLAAARLEESERRLATLMGNLPGMAYRCRNDPNWTMEFASEGVFELTGYPAEDLIGNRRIAYADLIVPDDQGPVWEKVQKAVSVRRVFHLNYRIRAAGGEERWVWERGRGVFDEAGELLALEGFITDISAQRLAEQERRELQAQMLHSQKLESLGVLAGGIAHDFNNLLTCILGYADLARQELSADSQALVSIEQIHNGAQRAADLTQQMLAYAGKGKFVVERIDISTTVRDMARLLEVSISKRARLVCNCPPNLPAVNADAAQIRQIIMNLIINASDAIGDRDGIITVSTSCRRWEKRELANADLAIELPAGHYLAITVADTGSGMSPETAARVFDPFFSTKFTGRGLGLAAVLGIVRGHAGTIRLETAPGQGTKFTVLLPICPDTVPAKTVAANRNADVVSGTILVIDDEETVREVASRMLKRAGFATLTAANGVLGMEVFAARRDEIVLILLDLTMPRMDGQETAIAIRKLDSRVPILLSSGYDEKPVHEPQNLFSGFIKKPYASNELLAAIRIALGMPEISG